MNFISLNRGMKTINEEKIIAVENATYALAVIKPEKTQAYRHYLTLTSAIPVQHSNELS